MTLEPQDIEKLIDNPVRMDYLRNKLMTEKYSEYQYYMAIKEVANSIMPDPNCKYLNFVNLI